MKVEVSKLFSLNFAPDWVANAHVGDGVYIQEIKLSGWLADFCKKLQRVSEEFCQDLLVFQRFQWRPYTHRLYNQCALLRSVRSEIFIAPIILEKTKLL